MDCTSYEKFRKWQISYAKKLEKQAKARELRGTEAENKYKKELQELQDKSAKKLQALRMSLRKNTSPKIVTVNQCSCKRRQRCCLMHCCSLISCAVFGVLVALVINSA